MSYRKKFVKQCACCCHLIINVYKLLLIIRLNDIDTLNTSIIVIIYRLITSTSLQIELALVEAKDLNGYAYQSFYRRHL